MPPENDPFANVDLPSGGEDNPPDDIVVDPPNDPPNDPPRIEPDPLEEETFRAVRKFNRAVKKTRDPEPDPGPSPRPTPIPEPQPPAPGPGRGFLDPFKRTRR